MNKRLLAVLAILAIVAGAAAGHAHHRKKAIAVKTAGSYVALGDSVAAGAGLETDSDPTACDRTRQAYPNLVAGHLNYKLTNLACSGATLPAGILGSQDVNQLHMMPQLQQLFAQPRPALISMTIGVNDTGWSAFIAKCYSGECGTAADTAQVNQRLTTVTANLQTVLGRLQQHYGEHMPRIVVTGYYQLFPDEASNCPDLINIDASKIAWERHMQTNIDATLQAAVAGSKQVSFVPVSFAGHELCMTDSWVQGLNDNAPFHPTDKGQAAYARQIIAVVRP